MNWRDNYFGTEERTALSMVRDAARRAASRGCPGRGRIGGELWCRVRWAAPQQPQLCLGVMWNAQRETSCVGLHARLPLAFVSLLPGFLRVANAGRAAQRRPLSWQRCAHAVIRRRHGGLGYLRVLAAPHWCRPPKRGAPEEGRAHAGKLSTGVLGVDTQSVLALRCVVRRGAVTTTSLGGGLATRWAAAAAALL